MKRSFRGQAARTLAVSAMAACLAMGSFTAAFAETSGGELKSGAAEAASQEEIRDWLAIGSVVVLKGYDQKFMILGRIIQNASDDTFYDYCACLYPDGYQGGDLYFFNKDDISEVAYAGFEDEYEQMYREKNLEGVDVDELTKKAQEMETAGEETEEAEAAETENVTEAAEQADTETAAEASENETEKSEAAAESETAAESEAAAESETVAESETEEPETEAAEEGADKEGKTFTTTSNVRLRSEATTDSDILATIPAGREVKEDTARKEKDGWVPVLFTDSADKELSGWIKKDFLK